MVVLAVLGTLGIEALQKHQFGLLSPTTQQYRTDVQQFYSELDPQILELWKTLEHGQGKVEDRQTFRQIRSSISVALARADAREKSHSGRPTGRQAYH